MFFSSCNFAIEAEIVTELVKQHIAQDSALFAQKMQWQEYRYSSSLRTPPSLKNLDDCLVPLQVNLKSLHFINRTKYRVICNNSVKQQKWTVNFNANIRYYVPVVTSASSLQRDHNLTSDDLKLTEQRVRDNDYYFNIDTLVGRKLKRNLRSNSVIQNNDIITEYVVTKGTEVLIIVEQNSLTLSTTGIALESAGLGDSVEIENKDSGTIITATVTGKDTVAVNIY